MQDDKNDQGETFEQWLAKVDKVLVARIGFDHMDLEDFLSFDAWDDGMTAEEGAEACLENDSIYSQALEEGSI